MNACRYDTVLEVCALKPDIAMLAGGDLVSHPKPVKP